MLAPDHLARAIFLIVGTLNLSGFTRNAKAVEGQPGRPFLSPQMMLALWLYALSQGIGSAREIERLCATDQAFGWLTRGLSVSHDALSAFLIGHRQVLDQLLADVLATLLHQGLLSLERVAQDGTRIRASASAPSFRRLASLQDCREQALLHLQAVLAQADGSLADGAREAKARDFLARVEGAIATVKELQAQKKPGEREARASTTDPDARTMKMPDGGFRPAYNFQFAVDGEETGGPRTIVGFRATNVGSDMGSVEPMIRDVACRTGLFPHLLLADANHAKHACLEYAAHVGIGVLMAVPEKEQRSKKAVSEPVAAWRKRMESVEGKRLYQARAGLVELVNAQVKDRFELTQVLVRGLEKVTCVGLMVSLAFNLTQHLAALLP